MYKADNFDAMTYEKIKKNDFTNFDNYFSPLILEHINKINNQVINSFKSTDFEAMTKFSVDNSFMSQ